MHPHRDGHSDPGCPRRVDVCPAVSWPAASQTATGSRRWKRWLRWWLKYEAFLCQSLESIKKKIISMQNCVPICVQSRLICVHRQLSNFFNEGSVGGGGSLCKKSGRAHSIISLLPVSLRPRMSLEKKVRPTEKPCGSQTWMLLPCYLTPHTGLQSLGFISASLTKCFSSIPISCKTTISQCLI